MSQTKVDNLFLGQGAVVQVVTNVVSGGNVAVASTTYTDTGATITITPKLVDVLCANNWVGANENREFILDKFPQQKIFSN